VSRNDIACLVLGFDMLEHALGYHGCDRDEPLPGIDTPSETDGEQPPVHRPTPHNS
jgi:hypothetical protein